MSDELDPEAQRIGAAIRALRVKYGLKTGEMAVALGKSQPYISNIEIGRKRAPLSLCRDVAELFDVPLALITIDGYEEIRKAAEAKRAAKAA
jgi:transcriptional regulator with XRE-family HTH domain